MPDEAAELRLAAIMFTDLVKRHPEPLRPLVEQYHGEWVQDVGDA